MRLTLATKIPELRPIAANILWLGLDKALRLVATVVVAAWIARYLGPEKYGKLTFALAITAFFQALVGLGLDGIVVRDLVLKRDRNGVILGSALAVRGVAAVFAWVAAVYLGYVIHPDDPEALVLVGIISAVVLFQPADVIDLLFQSRTQSRLTVLAKVAALVGANGLKCSAILLAAPLYVFALAHLLEFGLSALVLVLFLRAAAREIVWQVDLELTRRLLLESWPLLMGSLAVSVYMRLSQLFISHYSGPTEFGKFAAVLPFAEAGNVVATIVCMSAAPTIAKLKVADRVSYENALSTMFSVLLWLAAFLATVLAAIAPKVVALLLGDAYLDAIPTLRLLAFTSIPVFLGVVQGLWIINEGKTNVALAQTFVGALVSVAASVHLVPRYGSEGGAVALLVSEVAAAILANALIAPPVFLMQMKALLWPFRFLFSQREIGMPG